MANYDNSNSGALFANERKRSENSPSHTGECQTTCPHCGAVTEFWLSAWVKSAKSSGKRFFSLAFTAKDQPNQSAPAPAPAGGNDEEDYDEDIPF